MPTIPRFHVTQDAAWVFVHVHVPYVRVSEMEFYVDGTHFTFFCKPYLLKLQFPHEVVDDELAKAVYDPNKDHGTIVVHLPKKEPGQEFEDLDMLTKLLQPKEPPIDLKMAAAKANAPLIEVLNSCSTDANEADSEARNGADSAQQLATQVQAEPTNSSLLDLEDRVGAAAASGVATSAAVEPETVRITNLKPTYGFNNAYSDFFRVWHGEVTEILSLPDPENIPADQRRVLREAAEEEQFDVERYLLDFLNKDDDMYYDLAMSYEPFWTQYPVVARPIHSLRLEPVRKKSPLIMEVVSVPSPPSTDESNTMESNVTAQLRDLQINDAASASSATAPSFFSDADRELLLRLPHKEYLIERGSKDEAVLFGGLVDILIGFTYEQLTSQGDSSIESTWTISIISPTLGWLDTTSDLRAVVRTAVRRILSFPFLRQYDLAMRVLKETNEILKRGKRVVLRALLELYRIVEKSETQYLLNTLYIQDYCVWIQSVADEQLLALSKQLTTHVDSFQKADTGWGLEAIERSLLEEEDSEASSSSEEEDDSSSEDESSSEEEEESDDEDEGKDTTAPKTAT
ncbi:Shq1 like protein, partial [Globisporangium splendens]